MSVLLTDGSKGLFDILGKAFKLATTVNTATLTTIPTDVSALLTKYNNLASINLTTERTIATIPAASLSWQQASAAILNPVAQFAGQYIVDVFDADSPLNPKDLDTALRQLIKQMIGAGSLSAPDNDVDASTVACSAAAYSGNSGTGTIVISTKRGDGQTQQNMLGETLVANCITGGASASFNLFGGGQAPDKMGWLFPSGSGASIGLVAAETDDGLLTNGGFDESSDRTNTPDDWIIPVGTISTTIGLTTVEVQTIAISGTPTTGTYAITWTNLNSKQQTTAPLAYNATATEVQTALRALEGLEYCTVTATGTTPNWTHTITFLGAGGNQSQFTVRNDTDQTITPGTTTAGTSEVYSGSYAVKITGDGSQLTQIRQLVDVAANGQYAFGGLFLSPSAPAAGVITVDLYDGSAVINDDYGTANSFTIDCTTLTTSFAWKTGSFRLPRTLPPLVYLRIHVSTAITNTKIVYFDDCRFVQMAELYAGGPSVAILSGSTPFAQGDYYTLTSTNDRAGLMQEWFERAFSMRERGLLLPFDTGGTETIGDALCS